MDGVESALINIDVEGQRVCTMRHVLMRSPESRLCMSLERNGNTTGDTDALFPMSNGTIFIDGDAKLIRILINALRHPQMELVLPDNFDQWSALLAEVRVCNEFCLLLSNIL
ncbi:hypothetical protein Tcan_14936 [Toxocara canis]|uniref:BTB domain-containing protein n=2 Tax=Toxocara canis TaxID=6265 RepID=A0A0B2V002_TOXCA|nr:hypothetical protein Tcan_14936 [Toxocara canis]VDM51074.1 unnamed protein product [Toxocara canis]